MFADLELHELVEWLIPLHQYDAYRQGPTQVLVAIVGVPAHTAPCAATGVRYLRCGRVLPAENGGMIDTHKGLVTGVSNPHIQWGSVSHTTLCEASGSFYPG